MSSQTNSEQELLARISELETEIKQLKKQKKYGLVWEDHTEDVVLQCQNNVPILKEVKSRKIVDKDTTKPTNILIEGDNYHALSVLNYTHRGKIDVIYIDPPYNTENNDFKYNDTFIDKNDNYRHSKWISFMNLRLRLSKYLMSENAVVFISIDDREQAQLKLLCDSVFGGDNFVTNLTWIKKEKASGVPPKTMIIPNFEYILVYKNNDFSFKGSERSLKSYKQDKEGRYWRYMPIQATGFQNNFFTIVNPKTGKGYHGNWALSQETINEIIKNERLIFPKKDTGKPVRLVYADEMSTEGSAIFSALGKFDSETATKQFNQIFGKKVFDFPKPLDLIQFICSQSNKDSVILDFFAGSGTTGHAVMELNKQDGGNRQFILCTNNENNICEEVTYERLKRVMKGYKNKKGETVEGLGGNLRYFKTELCDVGKLSRVTDDKKLALTYRVGGLLALKENTFEEIEHTDHWQIFMEHNACTAVYFSEDKTLLHDLIKKLGDYHVPVKMYVFSWSKNEYASELLDYKHITVSDIPEPILAVYRDINNL